MKFGQNLPRNQVPEWASEYINYKGLKKLIKAAEHNTEAGGEVDLAEFFFALDRNLEDVDSFYNRKHAEFSRRLRLLYDRYGQAAQLQDGIDKEEMEDLMGALLELRGQYRNLIWFGEVNRRGFVKITKKLDKKIEASHSQNTYLAAKVDPKAFANNRRTEADMRAINDWLSNLGDVKVFDDTASIASTGSLHRVSSKNAMRVPTAVLDALEQNVRQNDLTKLQELISTSLVDISPSVTQKLMLNLLQRAISARSHECITYLLSRISSLTEDDDMNKRNIIHRLVIATGRARALEENGPAAVPIGAETNSFINAAELPVRVPTSFKVQEKDLGQTLGQEDPAIKLMVHILSHLSAEQRAVLKERDTYGRLPLHYAGQYGLVAAAQTIIKYMQAWGQFDVSKGIDSDIWQDAEGYAPLHLSVIGGHYRTTKALLLAEDWHGESEDSHAVRRNVEKSGAALALATKNNFFMIVKLLVDAGININHQDEQGETALHIAARFGYVECTKSLLEGSETQKANLEITEKTYGWTPIFIACVDGHLPIVELLIEAGCETNKADLSGWLPIEHAALRGHLDVSNKLADLSPTPENLDVPSPHLRPSSALGTSPKNNSSIEDRRSNVPQGRDAPRIPEPVKTFGHRYLTDESLVLVSLGSMDNRKNIPAVTLDNIPLADAHATQLDTALSLVVAASGANGEPTIVDLPVQENISTSPITFKTRDPTKVRLLFDIVPTYSGSKDKIVGRGVALLSSIKPSIGSKRMLLQGDLSVPIVAAETLDVIGSVNFNFLIITPFQHPNMHIAENQTYWKSTSTQVIGHRGLGKNMASMKSLQLGENTLQSFIAAANLGASYVEFDVQLTKDHVPVIYHDFLVSETGIDAPVHTLTLEQFMHASEGQTPRPSRPSSPKRSHLDGVAEQSRKQRSYSLGGAQDERAPDMSERMKHTRDFKEKGFKGNSRGNFIQAPFTTLEEMFKTLPSSIGFNIEMKYPMLFESEEHDMDTYAVELNSFVDTVLTKVYDLGTGRNMLFSSFNPEICLLLSFKQPSIPILFLSDAGTSPVGDIRASSLQEAIRFASRWNLLGVVSAAEPLVTCPRLIRVVKESGLVCVSYGTLNNNPTMVARQAKEGIDAVIVDSVLAIRKELTAAQAGKMNGDADGYEAGKVIEVPQVITSGKANGVTTNGHGQNGHA
ncbi:GDPD-domain-containing protein [Aureobasidium pullulans]|uniref:GDPD-domain-containing protein n=1 Tax=Aureobasidium pullulans TaxID=5580 RepID=A0A4S9GMR8_AURPU|nr:GDPD-domain-containing protein [Aureobasidium pullulans]THX62747.1 GDPD-domain-containing protein [Aureobasidium pullulans]THZ47062.1 GDPD-domain-containing protein [Aureobasidium pullulans]